MKKLLHVALLFVLTFTSILNAQKINEKSFSELMDLSGINKQIAEYPGMVKAGMTQARTQNDDVSNEEFIQMNKAVDKSFKTSKMLKIISLEIRKKITQKDIDNLLKWYKSDLGKKITKAEEDASTPQAYAKMLKEAPVLLKNKKKVFFAKRIDKLLNVTQMVTELQINTAIAVFSAMNHPSKSQMSIFRSQISSQKRLIKANVEQMIILSFAYSYRNIDDNDLQTYMSFLKETSTKKFNDSAMRGMVKALNSSVEEMAESFATISK